jgi:hypothetical protein
MNLRLDNRPDDLGVEGPDGPARRPELTAPRRVPIDRAWRRRVGSRGLAAACLVAVVGCGLVLIYLPSKAVLLVFVVPVVVAVYRKPGVAGYMVIFITPLVAGINRGSIIPFFRPNEAVDLLVGSVLFARGVIKMRSGGIPRLRLDRFEWAFVILAFCSSVLPLLWLFVRDIHPTSDDLQYSVVLWKYFGLYLLVRFSIRTAAEVQRALWFSLWACAVVCLVAVLQSLGLFGVPHLLSSYYAPFGVDGALSIARGSSLLSLPAAVGDLAILNLAIVAGMFIRGIGDKRILGGLAGLFIIGALSSAEFSSVIALVIAAIALSFFIGGGRMMKIIVPSFIVGGYALKPVISDRLAGFHTSTGLPVSWTGRLNNLRTYFWPQLFSHWNWLLGVRPAARVPVPSQAFGFVWIESGYTWLLWGGGIPLLGSYFWFVWVAMRRAWALARVPDIVGVAALAIFATLASQVVVMWFDPHLTYRGSGDALFCLMAMARPALSQTKEYVA